MAYSSKVRISIAVSPELNERIESMAKRMGMSKATLCSVLVSQQIDTFEKTWEMLGNPELMGKLLSTFAPNVDKETFAKNYDAQVEKEKKEK